MNVSFRLVGHRGAPAYEPENTSRSFFKAIECGATAIEFDVRRTADGIPVVIHDEELERLVGKRRKVSEIEFSELYKYKVQGKARIPTLNEVLALAKGRVALDIEIKTLGVEGDVVDSIKEYELYDSVLVTSFLPGVLKMVKDIDGDVKLGILVDEWDDEYLDIASELEVYAILPRHEELSREVIEKIKSAGYSIITWTVNDPDRAWELLSMGVDGIITDDPCKLCEVVKNE